MELVITWTTRNTNQNEIKRAGYNNVERFTILRVILAHQRHTQNLFLRRDHVA